MVKRRVEFEFTRRSAVVGSLAEPCVYYRQITAKLKNERWASGSKKERDSNDYSKAVMGKKNAGVGILGMHMPYRLGCFNRAGVRKRRHFLYTVVGI